jgi:uncharacterized membrane protein
MCSKECSTKKKEEMRKAPYWNFWRVIIAGWLIRYPGKVIHIFGVLIGFIFVLIYNVVMN